MFFKYFNIINKILHTLKIKTILKIAPSSFKLAIRISDCVSILKTAPDLENRSRELDRERRLRSRYIDLRHHRSRVINNHVREITN